MALLDCMGVSTPHNTLCLRIVKIRACGQAHNPSALGGLPLEPDTSGRIYELSRLKLQFDIFA